MHATKYDTDLRASEEGPLEGLKRKENLTANGIRAGLELSHVGQVFTKGWWQRPRDVVFRQNELHKCANVAETLWKGPCEANVQTCRHFSDVYSTTIVVNWIIVLQKCK
jgi:hypothetical protein